MCWDDPIRVAVSQRVLVDPEYGERRDALAQDWTDCFRRLHLLPLLIPNEVELARRIFAAAQVDALLLTGGNDLATAGSSPAADSAPERDQTERRLIGLARDRHLPVVGVCRGAQMLNRYFGGAMRPDAVPGSHVAVRHELRVRGRRGQAGLFVNSFHRWILPPEELGGGLEPWGWSTDGSVELFTHATDPITGLMWHPERPGSV